MQAYFLTRGEIFAVEKMIDFLKTRVVNWPITNDETGKTIYQPMQLIVRPIQLWEVAFPKESADLVYTSLGFQNGVYPDDWKMKLGRASLRKALGANPIPEFKTNKTLFMPLDSMQNIQIVPIGYREDKTYEHDSTGIEKQGFTTTHEAI